MRNCLEKGPGAELKAKDKRFLTDVILIVVITIYIFLCFKKLNHENLHFKKLKRICSTKGIILQQSLKSVDSV